MANNIVLEVEKVLTEAENGVKHEAEALLATLKNLYSHFKSQVGGVVPSVQKELPKVEASAPAPEPTPTTPEAGDVKESNSLPAEQGEGDKPAGS